MRPETVRTEYYCRRSTLSTVCEGEKLAARYMKEDFNVAGELGRYDEKTRQYVLQGACEIFLRNITLPRNDPARRTTKRAMEGLKLVKTDKVALENAYSRIRRVFEHYAGQGEQQRKQAYASLKAEVGAKLRQAMQQQFGPAARADINVERQPQFQEEWHRMLTQLDSQYLKLLDEFKQEIAGIR